MSRAVQDAEDQVPNLADLDVPMTDAAPDPDGDYNAAPPPLPELYDETGKQVPYVVDLILGKDGIKKETFDQKDDDGNKTGSKGVYFTADVMGKAIAAKDGREIDLAFFDTFLRPPQRWTSFTRKSKPMSEIAHLGKVAGLDLTDYETVGEMAQDLNTTLRQKGELRIQALAFIQWQWYSKETEYTTKSGDTKKGQVVRRNMKQADAQFDDGTYDAVITHKETGETLRARAVITRIEPLP
jgi:hypothetical protein